MNRFKILFLDEEDGSLFSYEEASIVDGCVVLAVVDARGNSLDAAEEFALHEIGNALEAISDLVEACQDD